METSQMTTLSLRMKKKYIPKSSDNSDLMNQVRILFIQDVKYYKSHDEKTPFTNKDQFDEWPLPINYDDIIEDSREDEEGMMEQVCREKICEWKYRIVDHLKLPREIVAISLSYLDRFIQNRKIDRTGYKLVALTSLYIAAKTHSSKVIPLHFLSNLSRGDFSEWNIEQMEMQILHGLKWKVNPPIVQSFIHAWYNLLLPLGKVRSQKIYDRAMFFAEIILYCNDFVCLDRALIALASVMNAIEGVYIEVSTEEERMIEKSIEDEFGIWYPQNQVEDLRSDIWHVFSMSAQYKVEDMMLEAIQAPKEPEGKKLTANDLGSEFSNSPTTVVKRPVRILE